MRRNTENLSTLPDEMEKEDDKDDKEGMEAVANHGPGGEDCEAKSEATCRCKDKYVPISLPPRMAPKEAIEKLKHGIKVANPLGEVVELGKKMLGHWESEDQKALEKGRKPKTQEEKDARLAALPLIERVIERPKKIIENDDGSRTYLAEAVDRYKQKGKRYIVAFTTSEDVSILRTYRVNNRPTFKGGKQIWPDTSDT